MLRSHRALHMLWIVIFGLAVPGCDYWHRVEMQNTLDVPVGVRARVATTEFIKEVHCSGSTAPGEYADEVALTLPAGESRCISGANGGFPYNWEDTGMTLEFTRGSDACATLDGAATDGATDKDGRIIVDETFCPSR